MLRFVSLLVSCVVSAAWLIAWRIRTIGRPETFRPEDLIVEQPERVCSVCGDPEINEESGHCYWCDKAEADKAWDGVPYRVVITKTDHHTTVIKAYSYEEAEHLETVAWAGEFVERERIHTVETQVKCEEHGWCQTGAYGGYCGWCENEADEAATATAGY